MPIPSAERAWRWLPLLAASLFALYAANFLYFFVDDEGIPFVYAQNVLQGHGLSYSVLEGHVEGYSDFLHVWQDIAILALATALRMPKIAVFFIGKAVSFICGIALVALGANMFRHVASARAGSLAGLAVLVLAGPLAVWSCSSLETIPFTLGVTALLWTLVTRRDTGSAIASAFVLLERIDGFIFVAALVGAFILTADRSRRRQLLRRVALPSVVVFSAYNVWRLAYFGDLLPAPLQAKVLYKLTAPPNIVVRKPAVPYWIRFVETFGWPAAVAFGFAAIPTLWRGGAGRAVTIATVTLLVYVSVVGDWMFGFRFFVPIIPLIATVVACSVGLLSLSQPRLARWLTAAAIVWLAVMASRFLDTYRAAEKTDSFIARPSTDLHRFFRPYYNLFETARSLPIRPGDVVSYNQAGFLPFMLSVTNIDDLGICSRFYARLPATDVFFTEVGRYTPLTDKPAVGAGQAYLLYANAQFIIARSDLLRSANQSRIPTEVLGGYYALAATDATGDNAIYRRTERPAGRFASDPTAFVENLVHTSHIRKAAIEGRVVDPHRYLESFPYLRMESGNIDVNGSWTLDLVFADRDQDVQEFSIEDLVVDHPTSLSLSLFASDGRLVHRQIRQLESGHHRVSEQVPRDTRAARFVLALSLRDAVSAHARLGDVRLQGQSDKLHAYIVEHLRFAP